MKTILIILFYASCNYLLAEEKEIKIKTEVNEVTVFLEGAQIISKKNVEMVNGKNHLKFIELSPFIDAQTIRVKADKNVTILSVNHQQNYLAALSTSEELTKLNKLVKEIDDKVKIEQAYLSIMGEELAFFKDNRKLSGMDQPVTFINLKQVSEFYSEKITALKIKEIERNKNIEKLNEERYKVQQQINDLSSKTSYAQGEIVVVAECKTAGVAHFEISYIVSNASWFPSYDIRVNSINEPVELVYKANVRQDTKVDWKDAKLKFSTANPGVSGSAPKLLPYFLNYSSLPPVYNGVTGTVRGRVTDVSTNQSLPGVNVVVKGTTIGTVTDIDGNFTLTLPANAGNLQFSYIGYVTQEVPVIKNIMNISLTEDITSLDEVVVIGYGSQRKTDLFNSIQGKTSGASTAGSDKVKVRGITTQSISGTQRVNNTSVEFEIKTNYTINSNNKNITIEMESLTMPAGYEYLCVPKINKDAFLIANVTGWEKFNLLDGEANIFFENTYVGKSVLDVKNISDTLAISLGRDKNVIVNREKQKDFTTKQFIGYKKEETRSYKILVKNNKQQEISISILDQVPVSTLEEIEVSVQKISDGEKDLESGEIEWTLKVESYKQKELQLQYSVKYPKNRNLVIE